MQPAIIGYCDPWRARPGETLSFKVSSAGGRPFRSRVVRVRHADPNPAGPGMRLLPAPAFGEGSHTGREQQARPGSFGWARCPVLGEGPIHLVLNLRCLRHFDRTQCVLALQDGTGTRFAAIGLTNGEIVLRLSAGDAVSTTRTGIRLETLLWWSLGVGLDLASGTATLDVVELRPRMGPVRRAGRSLAVAAPERLAPAAWTHVAFGALNQGGAALAFDGQMEAPGLGAGALPDLAAPGGALRFAADRSLAAWDFSAGMTSQGFADRGPSACHGTFLNLPTRAMKGSTWSGRAMSWTHSPDEYGAVHFHSDDVGDLDWEESCVVTVPQDTGSGVHALVVTNDLGSDAIPFYVLPSAGRRSDRTLVFLAPTMTYLAYANHARGNWDDAFQARARAWGAAPNNPDAVPDFGFSTYNYHPDGSGIALSSRRRPVLSMRPAYLTFNDPRGSGLRHFPDDSHLLDWLEEKGFAFDVVTDEDLDDHGIDCIRDYATLITGSHPEYYTERMLNALEQFRAAGGNLCYMGGNGFYWRIARPEALPWALEIRRAESGIRAWASEPGEYYNQLDGTYGGLWRRNGRPPQALAEIGFAVQGLFEGSHYRRTPESDDPAAAWIFARVSEGHLGGFGLSGGGAAGFELDQISRHLGTGGNTVVLARSEGHGPSFLGVPEDILTHTLALGGRVAIEAHMVYGCNEAGGQVFATGSITFIGSLSHNGYDNAISQILSNVLQRFAEGPCRPGVAPGPGDGP